MSSQVDVVSVNNDAISGSGTYVQSVTTLGQTSASSDLSSTGELAELDVVSSNCDVAVGRNNETRVLVNSTFFDEDECTGLKLAVDSVRRACP